MEAERKDKIPEEKIRKERKKRAKSKGGKMKTWGRKGSHRRA